MQAKRGLSTIDLRDRGHEVLEAFRAGKTCQQIATHLKDTGCRVSASAVSDYVEKHRKAQLEASREAALEQARQLIPFATDALCQVVNQGLELMERHKDQEKPFAWVAPARAVTTAAQALLRVSDGSERSQGTLDVVLQRANEIIRIRMQQDKGAA
jgi:predicted transcriptional regulator